MLCGKFVRIFAEKLTKRQFQVLFVKFNSTSLPKRPRKPKSENEIAKKFVDFKKVKVRGGNGGDGAMTFLSLPFKEWAGPDGGDGGNGGHVIFQADFGSKSLAHLQTLLSAEDGVKGRSKTCHGKNAQHTVIKVPLGTLLKNDEGNIIYELKDNSDMYVAARGGAGGHGNNFFLSNENRAPTTYEQGAQGEQRTLFLELRVMANVGLVGFPNAGKSTLLRAISRAKPKVAAYPFTTINPHIGMVEYDDYEQIAVADIPGLIKGAHLNYGLGFSFLRHIERCSYLLYVLDLSQDEPWTQLEDLKFELEKYQTDLSKRPHAIVANKVDKDIAKENLLRLQSMIGNEMEIIPISAKYNVNVQKLLIYIKKMYDKYVEK